MLVELTAEESLYLDDMTTLLGERTEVKVGVDLKLRLGAALLAALNEGSIQVDFAEDEILYQLLQAIRGTDQRGAEHVGLNLKKKFYTELLKPPMPLPLSSVNETFDSARLEQFFKENNNGDSSPYQDEADYDPQD